MTVIDWNERRLCDDGGCTGIIGSDGRCHVCGRASQFWGDERRRGLRDDDVADAEAEQRRLARELPAAEGEIAERRLCPDGGCTGLIGDDGRCRVCGREDEGAPARPAPRRSELTDDLASRNLLSDALVASPPALRDDLGNRNELADPDVDDRRLCPDGGCTGLLGADGRCKVCGRRDEA